MVQYELARYAILFAASTKCRLNFDAGRHTYIHTHQIKNTEANGEVGGQMWENFIGAVIILITFSNVRK